MRGLALIAFRLFGYRRRVIRKNLEIVFPGQNEKFYRQLHRGFERQFSETLAESVKSFSLSRKAFRNRVEIFVSEEMKGCLAAGKDIFIAGAHIYNWEWVAIAAGDQLPCRTAGIYKPLSSEVMDRLVRKNREKLGAQMIPMALVARDILRTKTAPTAYLFLSDQSTPFTQSAHYIDFFGHRTPFVSGMAQLAHRKNVPIFYFYTCRKARGYYQVSLELLLESPGDMEPQEITALYGKKVEENILKEPAAWLWSHKRWKRVLSY